MSLEKKEDPTEVSPFIRDAAKDNNEKGAKDKPHKDVSCGFWIFKGSFLERFANEKMFVLIYGIGGLVFQMAFAYFNGTVTTLEKRFKIPSSQSGIILVGNDISLMLTGLLVGYYIREKHRPRWIGFGLFLVFVFCILTSSLHFLYGSGEDALKLTREFGNLKNTSSHAVNKKLCMKKDSLCIQEDGAWVPKIILFVGQLIAGIGITMYWNVGIPFMDDNTTKEKTPILLSAAAFLRMLGPALGYSLVSVCLRWYIEPTLTPLIKPADPRWMGAWWIGWLILAAVTFIMAFLIGLFPTELPKSKARRLKLARTEEQNPKSIEHIDLSVDHMWQSVKRLLANKVYIYNTCASNLYFFGYMAYWIYTPKYIETQYRTSASMASLATGTVALAFSAVGVLLSGYIVSKYKPSARAMAAWNATVDFVTVAGIICYIFIGCEGSDQLGSMATTTDSCNPSCDCEYVQYAPVCSPNNITYISACHAGCTGIGKDPLGHTIYTGCQCITASNITNVSTMQQAADGACPVDCTNQFIVFLVVMCFLKLVGASSKSTNMLISLRCIPPAEKAFAMGLNAMLSSMMAFVPSPIFFGWLFDKNCLVSGKTCSNKGNCWLYDTVSLRYSLNLIAAFFIFLGGVFNILVWIHAKDLKIFDDEKIDTGKVNSKPEKFNLTPVADVVIGPKGMEEP